MIEDFDSDWGDACDVAKLRRHASVGWRWWLYPLAWLKALFSNDRQES